MIIVRRTTSALVALACSIWAAPANAQLSKVGAAIVVPGGATAYSRTTDTAYDTTHSVFLTPVSEHYTSPGGRVFASFANSNGTALTAAFRLDTTANFPFGPAVAYSPEADVFLVVWVNGAGQVRGRLVRYGVNALGSADFAVSGEKVAGGAWSPAVAYSRTSQEFLVAYSKGSTKVARVSTAGGIIGQAVTVSAALASGYHWTQDPALTWNSANNEFLLTYAQELSPGWQIRAQRISEGHALGSPTVVQQAGSTKMPDAQYSAQSGKYLVTWFQTSPYGIYGRMVNASGSLVGSPQPMLPSNYGTYDANSLAYNDYSGTFAIASLTPQLVGGVSRDTIGGAEVSSAGTPSTAMRFVEADSGNRFYPEIAATGTNNRFLTVFNKSHATFYGQILASGGGGSEPPPPPPPPPPPSSQAALITAAEADFSGDSLPDLLWRHEDGSVLMWRMSGLSAAAVTFLGPGPVDLAWQLAGTGDLNGDGKPEIVWRHSAGWLYTWYMNGQILQHGEYLNPNWIDTPLWKLVAVADFNGDKKADLIWQHDHGGLAVWYMNGSHLIGSSLLNPSSIFGNDWKIVGAGDMNGDLKPDLIWQQTSTNVLGAWIMNGITATNKVLLTPNQVQAGWRVRGVVDLNADGVSDLVWRHTSGAVGVWLMQGTTAATMTNLVPGTVSPEWDFAGPR